MQSVNRSLHHGWKLMHGFTVPVGKPAQRDTPTALIICEWREAVHVYPGPMPAGPGILPLAAGILLIRP